MDIRMQRIFHQAERMPHIFTYSEVSRLERNLSCSHWRFKLCDRSYFSSTKREEHGLSNLVRKQTAQLSWAKLHHNREGRVRDDICREEIPSLSPSQQVCFLHLSPSLTLSSEQTMQYGANYTMVHHIAGVWFHSSGEERNYTPKSRPFVALN